MFARRACDTRVAKGGAVAAGWRWAQGMLLCVAHYSVEKLVLFVRTTNLTNQPCSKDDEGLLADPPGEKARSLQALEAIEACIERDAMSMMTHQQASRLVQRALGPCDVTSSPHVDNLVKVSREPKFWHWLADQYLLCAAQKNSGRLTIIFVQEVFRNMDTLAVHQNGNFVLQHILEFGSVQQRASIQSYACVNAVRLAMHKFGSHLVEKCLACATGQQVAAIVDRFLMPPPPDMVVEFRLDEADAAMALPLLMSDAYANFVVQKAYDVSKAETKLKLSREIKSRTVTLSKFSVSCPPLLCSCVAFVLPVTRTRTDARAPLTNQI